MVKTYDEMVAEALREVGVLVLVFVLLDRFVAGTITVKWTAAALGISGSYFLAGCFLGRWRIDA